MPDSTWRLQDAKAQFSAVVEAALDGTAQHVTRRGKRAVVVLAEADYLRLQRYEQAARPGFVSHLLDVPRSAERAARVTGQRPAPALRDIDFG